MELYHVYSVVSANRTEPRAQPVIYPQGPAVEQQPPNNPDAAQVDPLRHVTGTSE